MCCSPSTPHPPQVLNTRHTFLHRQALVLRASQQALTAEDAALLEAAGLRGSVLGRPDVACNPPVPEWLRKWAALILQYTAEERQRLPQVMVVGWMGPWGVDQRVG
jgi:hypothetical protein